MTENLFDREQIFRRKAQMSDAPVRAELTRRLEERLEDVRLKPGTVLRLQDDKVPVADEGKVAAVMADMVLPLVEDVPVFLVQCLQCLQEDGLLLATALGAESFREFRAAWAQVGESSGHVVPLTDVRDAGALLQRLKLALPVVDRDVLTVTFPDFPALYAALRAHGVGNFAMRRRHGLVTPRKLMRMEAAYRDMFGREDGRLPVTLEVIYMHGFKPAAGQPEAAKRGSGKVSLVRILDSRTE